MKLLNRYNWIKLICMKKDILRIAVILSLFIAPSVSYAQQDAQYSQYIFNGVLLNPAYAGYKEVWNAHALYRNQWTGIKGSPVTSTITVDGPVMNNKIGLGFHIMNDALGAQINQAFYASYAYRLFTNEDSRLSLGLSTGMEVVGMDISKLLADQANDPTLVNVVQKKIIPDAKFGIYYTNPLYFLGVGANNLISPHLSYNTGNFKFLPTRTEHYYLTSGMLVTIANAVKFRPSFLIKEDFHGPTNIDLNLFWLLHEKVWLGATYRSGLYLYSKPGIRDNVKPYDAFSFIAEFFANDRLRLGYAYDYTISDLSTYSSGSHEISVSYSFIPRKDKMLTPRYF